MKNFCIIPARGGSKRIPHKNIRPFCGKPIIAYSIEAAVKSHCFERVIVSTDDEAVKEIALASGAEVPFERSAELSGDVVTVLSAVKHGVQWLQKKSKKPFHVCMVYATAPFVRATDLQESLAAFTTEKGKSFCLAVTEFTYPIQRAVRLTSDGGMAMFQPEHFYSRSQDLVKAYHDAGQFCWGTHEAFLLELPVFERYTVPFLIPAYRVQDIDTPEDWLRAEAMYQSLLLTDPKRSAGSKRRSAK